MTPFKNAITYLFSGVTSQGIMFIFWLMLPWFIPPLEMGYLAIALFLVEILTMFCMVGMNAALIRFANDSYHPLGILKTSLFVSFLSFSLIAFTIWLSVKLNFPFSKIILYWLSEHHTLLLLTIAANMLLTLYQSYQLATYRAKEYAIIQILRAIVFLGAGVILVTFITQKSFIVLIASGLSAILVLTFYSRKTFFVSLTTIKSEAPEKMIRYGIPLMLYAVLGIITAYTQRLILDYYTDIETLGTFAFFNILLLRLNGLWASLNKAWTPRFFSLYKKNKSYSLELLRIAIACVCFTYPILLIAFIVINEKFLAKIIFPAFYISNLNILYALLTSVLFVGIYNVIYPLAYYNHNTNKILKLSVVTSIVNLGVSLILISTLGIKGATLSLVFTSIFSMWSYLYSYNDWIDKDRKVFKLISISSGLSFIATLTLVFNNNTDLCTFILSLISLHSCCQYGRPCYNFFTKTS